MAAFILRRLLYVIPVLLIVAFVTFVIMHATPGGPWDSDPGRRSADPRFQELLDRRYGLDKPLLLNPGRWRRHGWPGEARENWPAR